MILALAATEIEMDPFRKVCQKNEIVCNDLITGVGVTETALRLTKYFVLENGSIDLVINFGVGGVYYQDGDSKNPGLLDICLAKEEVFGDFGIALPNTIEYLDSSLTGELQIPFDNTLCEQTKKILVANGIDCYQGVFISVSSVSGYLERGKFLQRKWNGLCENMEGWSVARVCREFSVPCIELRCISNYVEDRTPENWCLSEASEKSAHTAALIVQELKKTNE